MTGKRKSERGYGVSVELSPTHRLLRERSAEIVAENKRRQNIRTKRNLIRKYLDRQGQPKKTPNEMLLEKLKKHYKRIEARRKYQLRKHARKYVADMKREAYRYRDMQHPQYKRFNKYRYYQFGDRVLTRSFDGLTANRAWALLRKCWIGFKDSARNDNRDGMVFYARGIQKYLYYLEEVPMDFGNLGVGPFK